MTHYAIRKTENGKITYYYGNDTEGRSVFRTLCEVSPIFFTYRRFALEVLRKIEKEFSGNENAKFSLDNV